MLETVLYRKNSFTYVQVSEQLFSDVGLNQRHIMKDHYFVENDRIPHRGITIQEYVRELVMYFLSRGESIRFCSGRYTLMTSPVQYKYDHFLELDFVQIPAQNRYQILEQIISSYLSVKEIQYEDTVRPLLSVTIGCGDVPLQIQSTVHRQISG